MLNTDAREATDAPVAPGKYKLDDLPEVLRFQQRYRKAQEAGIHQPYFRLRGEGPDRINLNSYNYLGLSGHPEVTKAAVEAAERFGTSASASRLVGGELPLHGQLEQELAKFLGTESALALVSGHATNVTLISFLMGPADMIIHDAYAHDSAIRGAQASRAKRFQFAHNDLDALEEILREKRQDYRRVLVLVEGLYSMDGDFPNLPKLLELQEKYKFLLMVDEAHSLGVLGQTGRGIAELQSVPRDSNIIWMGTLSKSLASCGGYLAGSQKFIQFLKHSLPGFVYSVGLSPPNSAAALAALKILQREPERVKRLQHLSRFFQERLEEGGFDYGTGVKTAIFPVFIEDPHQVMMVNEELHAAGVEASAIIFPAVPRKLSRLRFFLSSLNTEEQLERAVKILHQIVHK